MPRRATALPPDMRRAAILAAVLPVVLERGFAATTRELAQAAGVAEGTLFRVFASKDALVLAAASAVFARTDHLDELAAIDPAASLEHRLEQVVAIWQRVTRRYVEVFVVLRAAPSAATCPSDPRQLLDPEIAREADALVAGLLAADADRLRLPVADVVRVLGSLVLASVHPAGFGLALEPPALVDLLLHGVHRPAARPSRPEPEKALTLPPCERADSAGGIPAAPAPRRAPGRPPSFASNPPSNPPSSPLSPSRRA